MGVIKVSIVVSDLNLTSIQIDTESHLHIYKLRFLQTVFPHSPHELWNATAPSLHQIHISESIGQGAVSDFGVSLFHQVNRHAGKQTARRSNF